MLFDYEVLKSKFHVVVCLAEGFFAHLMDDQISMATFIDGNFDHPKKMLAQRCHAMYFQISFFRIPSCLMLNFTYVPF